MFFVGAERGSGLVHHGTRIVLALVLTGVTSYTFM